MPNFKISQNFSGVEMSYKIFEELCKQRNVKPIEISRSTGIDSATFSSWKKGTYTPKTEKRKLIADYFGVSLEYLDTGKDSNMPDADPEAIILMQKLEERPELKTLLRVADGVSKEDIEAVVRLLKK